MQVKSIISFVFLFVIYKAEALNVSVYYETLCPGSIQFITTQLYPSFKQLADFINVELVPFGKANFSNSTGHWEFQCQHGPVECLDNKIHACVFSKYPTHVNVEFVNCAMNSHPQTGQALKLCGEATNVLWDDIEECFNSDEGDELLVNNGLKTHAVTPPITYIPTITFNGKYDEKTEDEAQTDLFNLICELLNYRPAVCRHLRVAVLRT